MGCLVNQAEATWCNAMAKPPIQTPRISPPHPHLARFPRQYRHLHRDHLGTFLVRCLRPPLASSNRRAVSQVPLRPRRHRHRPLPGVRRAHRAGFVFLAQEGISDEMSLRLRTKKAGDRPSVKLWVVRRPLRRFLKHAIAGFVLASLVAWGGHLLSGFWPPPPARLLVHEPRRAESSASVVLGFIRGNAVAAEAWVDAKPRNYGGAMAESRDAKEWAKPHFMKASDHWIATRPPVSPWEINPIGVETHSCGWPLKMYRSVSVQFSSRFTPRSGRRRNIVDDPDVWPEPLPIGASVVGVSSTNSSPSPTFPPRMSIGHPTTHILQWGGLPTDRLNWINGSTLFQSYRLPERIPFAPWWPGLLANTMVLGVTSWLASWSLAIARRRIHRWRHPTAVPCPKCRYDLAGLDTDNCPECGAPTNRPANHSNRSGGTHRA